MAEQNKVRKLSAATEKVANDEVVMNRLQAEMTAQLEEVEVVAEASEQPKLLNIPTEQEKLEATIEVAGVNPTKVEKHPDFKLLSPLKYSDGTPVPHTLSKLSDLVPLDSTPIPNAKLSMRTINKAQLESLMQVDDEKLPPIKVQRSTMGFIVIDGYHRWARAAQLAKAKAEEVTHETEPDATAIEAIMNAATIKIEVLDLQTPIEVMKAAFSANLDHGLPASPTSRSRYALWLIELATAEGRVLSIRAAAKEAKVSHVAVMEYRDKQLKRQETEKMTDETADEDAKKVEARAQRSAQSLVKAVKSLYTDFSDGKPDDLAQYLVEDYTKDDAEMLRFFATAFSQLVTLANK